VVVHEARENTREPRGWFAVPAVPGSICCHTGAVRTTGRPGRTSPSEKFLPG